MNRREQIIACTRELYEEKGLTKTSVQDIADKVGVARSLFYHYFTDKDDVTSAVLDSYIEEFLVMLKAWNEQRIEGDVEHALHTLVPVLRRGLFDRDSFRRALASRENAASTSTSSTGSQIKQRTTSSRRRSRTTGVCTRFASTTCTKASTC